MVHAICRPSQRTTTLDVLQGLGLLGLLINQAYAQPVYSLPLDDHQTELPVRFIVQLLVAGQFDRMGSFLFGLGIYRCWQQAKLADLDADRITRRILIGMLGIGLFLSLLLRSIDLLVCYAGLGFTLLYVRKQSVSSLLTWLVGVSGLAAGGLSALALLYPAGMTRQSQGFWFYLSYELMMLFGLLVGKLGLWPLDPRLKVRLSLFQVGLLPAALLVKGTWVVVALGLVALPQQVGAYQPVLLTLSGFFGPLLLTLVYILDVGVNARLSTSGWTRWMGRIGQLSLTNYVLQSILCPLLLYGYGVAVSFPLPLLGRAGLVVGIYGFQLFFSYVWLRQYRLGPLEWVCHRWIYTKWDHSNSITTAKR